MMIATKNIIEPLEFICVFGYFYYRMIIIVGCFGYLNFIINYTRIHLLIVNCCYPFDSVGIGLGLGLGLGLE
jgi:hypothetical protein